MHEQPSLTAFGVPRVHPDDPAWQAAKALLRELAVDLSSCDVSTDKRATSLYEISARDLLLRPKVRRDGVWQDQTFFSFCVRFNVSVVFYGHFDVDDTESHAEFCRVMTAALATPQTQAQTRLRQLQRQHRWSSPWGHEVSPADEAYLKTSRLVAKTAYGPYEAIRQELDQATVAPGNPHRPGHYALVRELALRAGAPVQHFRHHGN